MDFSQLYIEIIPLNFLFLKYKLKLSCLNLVLLVFEVVKDVLASFECPGLKPEIFFVYSGFEQALEFNIKSIFIHFTPMPRSYKINEEYRIESIR